MGHTEFVEFSEAAAGLSETALATASLAEKRAQGREFANMVKEVKAVKPKNGRGLSDPYQLLKADCGKLSD